MKTLFTKNIKFIHRSNKNLILDPTFQIKSEELVLNGNFSEQSLHWTFEMDVNFTNDKANVNGNGYIAQFNVFSQTKTYQIQYTVTNYQQGSMRYRTGQLGTSCRSNETHTDIITFPLENNHQTKSKCAFRLSSDFIGSIDNISGKEIYANWNTLNNFFIDTNQVGYIICNGEGSLIQNNILEIGLNYEITIHLVNTNNSAVFFINSPDAIKHSTETSILKFEFISTQTYLSLSSENFIGKISEVTLIKK